MIGKKCDLNVYITTVSKYVTCIQEPVEKVISLSNEIFPNRDSVKSITSRKLNPKYVAFVIDKNGKTMPVGFIIWKIDREDAALLYRIGVKEGYRRMGIGTSLVIFSIETIPCSRVKCKVILHCSIDNRLARLFYEKIGFRLNGIIDKYYASGEPACEYIYDIG